MDRKHIIWHTFKPIILLLLAIFTNFTTATHASAKLAPMILLSDYEKEMKIGEEDYLYAYSSDGRIPKFSSSDRKIATVDIYGKITAKKPGKCTITVKAFTTEVYCSLKVLKTQITLDKTYISIENNETVKLSTEISDSSIPTFKSNKKSVAIVDDDGNITACKPGSAVITVKAGSASANCTIKVKQPIIKLDRLYKSLYRCQSFKLNATVSSGTIPVWKSNKKSVAIVDENGKVTAVKHGTALITASADGVSKTCQVVVEPPVIKLDNNSITLKPGDTSKLDITISSGNAPVWTSNKDTVATVDQLGNIYALAAGTCTITAAEDGTKAKCTVHVTTD